MFKLILKTRECISCAICVDVCKPVALSMRAYKGKTIEGLTQIQSNEDYSYHSNIDSKLSFPYLLNSTECNGCMVCVKECPVLAIEIQE